MKITPINNLAELRDQVRETRGRWERAYEYCWQVAVEARQRAEFMHFHSPVRKEYDRAVKALEAARCKRTKKNS